MGTWISDSKGPELRITIKILIITDYYFKHITHTIFVNNRTWNVNSSLICDCPWIANSLDWWWKICICVCVCIYIYIYDLYRTSFVQSRTLFRPPLADVGKRVKMITWCHQPPKSRPNMLLDYRPVSGRHVNSPSGWNRKVARRTWSRKVHYDYDQIDTIKDEWKGHLEEILNPNWEETFS